MHQKLLFQLKHLSKTLTQQLGYDITSRRSHLRPAGDMVFMLETLKERGLKVQWILDVGANKGEWSRMAKSVFSQANCFLIEPQLELQSKLDQFCQQFPGSQWKLAGAGSTAGELCLTVWDDLAGSLFLPDQATTAEANQQRIVPVITIDTLISENTLPVPEIVKLDVQGFELEVLKGASQLFDKTEVFILEVALFEFLPGQPLFAEVVQFMHDRGYVVYDFPGFIRRPYDGALGQCDVCFVRRDGFLRTVSCWA
ncbi:FkbM family methyltransferase [Leptolyngbya sp. AN03gr2]|uniref:FkbM family methyltransferase n=1 Tax=unclassified Leptolyngbya TaxID=2650499 RepID=UPI003D31087E